MKKQYSIFFVMMLILSISHTAISQVTILGANFEANSVSNNGESVVGTIGNTHFIWTQANGLTQIGGITNGFPMSGVASISDDGLKISATITNPDNNFNEMAIYDVATEEWTLLGGIGGPIDSSISSAWSISNDGTTVVGLGWTTGANAHGIKWTDADGMVDLGSSVPNRSSRANDTNNDGSVIVGWQDAVDGFRQAARWVDGVQNLITDQGGNAISEAGAVSGDGNWVVGGGLNFEAWRWSEVTGAIAIPHPNSGFSFSGSATSINEDGSVIIGFYRPFGPALLGEGFIWTEETGRVELNAYVNSLGMDDLGITLSLPLGISNDGSTIVGLGLQGPNVVGFMIKLPTVAANDLCENAIVLSCDDTVSGSTSNATNIAGTDAPDVFYSYTGNGSIENITISLCNTDTNFDTILRVFSSCDLTDEIAVNDDFCDLQSEVTFESDGTTTYIIMVEGFDVDESGDFTLQVSCETLSTSDFNLNQLSMYPNPTSGIVNIKSNVLVDSVQIYNTAGQLVLIDKVNATNSTINISSLQNGIYFAEAISKDASKVIKIVKK